MISKIIGSYNLCKSNNLGSMKQSAFIRRTLGADTVSFSSSVFDRYQLEEQNKIPDNTKIASEFGLKLLNSGKNLTPKLLKTEIQNFFKKNNIENVDIKNLSELPYAPISTPGGFFNPDLNENLKGIKGGTVYIGSMPDTNDINAMTAYISFVCHELTHALQYSSDKSNFGFEKELTSREEAMPIFSMINRLKGKIIPKLQIEPLHYLSKNYKELNLTKYDILELQNAIDKYHLPMLKKPVNINRKFIEKSLSPNIPFKDTVEYTADMTINNYIVQYKKHYGSISKEKEASLKRAVLKRYIYEFKIEREAYMTACEIIKKQNNIKGSIIYDLVPETYKMIEEILSGKLNNEAAAG